MGGVSPLARGAKLALSAQEQAWILEYVGCSKETMNYWCAYRWMAKGDSIFK